MELAELPHLKSKIVSDTTAEGMLEVMPSRSTPPIPTAYPGGPHGPVPQRRSGQDLERPGGRPLLAHHLRPRHEGLGGRAQHALLRAARPRPRATTAASIAARTAAKAGNASTRCRSTAPSCRSRCIRPIRPRSISAPATTARCSAPRTPARPGRPCRSPARCSTYIRWRAAKLLRAQAIKKAVLLDRLSRIWSLSLDRAAGPAEAGVRQWDLGIDQAIFQNRDTGLVIACIALGHGNRFRRADLRRAVFAPLVAQGLAVGLGIQKNGRLGRHDPKTISTRRFCGSRTPSPVFTS